MAGAVASLKAAETALEAELWKLEAWRALLQLEDREARGDQIQTVDGLKLKAALHVSLDRQLPQWRALRDIREAMARLTGAAPAPARDTHADLAEGADGSKMRIKVKAATLSVPRPDAATSGAPGAQGPQASDAVPAVSLPATPVPQIAPLASASPIPPIPAPERQRADLSRIRLIGSVLQPRQAADPAPNRDRFGGVLPWSAPGEPPPAPTEPQHPMSVAELPAPRPRLAPPSLTAAPVLPPIDDRPLRETAAVAPSATPDAAQPEPRPTVRGFAAGIAASLPAPIALDPPPANQRVGSSERAPPDGSAHEDEAVIEVVSRLSPNDGHLARGERLANGDRLSALEADLDALVGVRGTRVWPTGAHDDEVEVDEAVVEIVNEAARSDRGDAAPSRPVSAPVALSIRLKQPEHTAEFDSASYEAYRADIEEAEVEIVRTDDPEKRSQHLDPDPPTRQQTGRRFLKVFSSE